jgi:hypothetical protein
MSTWLKTVHKGLIVIAALGVSGVAFAQNTIQQPVQLWQTVDATEATQTAPSLQTLAKTLMQRDALHLQRVRIQPQALLQYAGKGQVNDVGVTAYRFEHNGKQVLMHQRNDVILARIRSSRQTQHLIAVGSEGFVYDAGKLRREFSDDHAPMVDVSELGSEASQASSDEQTGEAVYDLYAVYTQPTIDLYGSEDAVLARISQIIDYTNEIYQNSGVEMRANLLHAALSGMDPENTLRNYSAMYAFEEVIEADLVGRGADIVAVFRPYANDGTCGVANVPGLTGEYLYDPDYVRDFSKVYTQTGITIECEDSTLAHEVGHTQGLMHSREQDGQGGLYAYGLGYGVQDEFVTVMGYTSTFNAGYIDVFSSPELDCDGLPCGYDHTDRDKGADAVRALNNVRFAYQDRVRRTNVEGELLSIVTEGDGVVTGADADIQCQQQARCNFYKAPGESYALTATAQTGYQFAGWQGACEGSGKTCTGEFAELQEVKAVFTPAHPFYTDISYTQALDIEGTDIAVSTDNAMPDYSIPEEYVNDPRRAWEVIDYDKKVGDYALVATNRYEQPLTMSVYLGRESGVFSFWVKTDVAQEEPVLAIDVSSSQRFKDGWGQVIDATPAFSQSQQVSDTNGEWQQVTVDLSNQSIWPGEVWVVTIYDTRSRGQVNGNNRIYLDGFSMTGGTRQNYKVNVEVEGQGQLQQTEELSLWGDTVACLPDCFTYAQVGELVSVTAEPYDGADFIGWTGVCEGQGLTCEFTVTDTTEIVARFSGHEQRLPADLNNALDAPDIVWQMMGGPPWRVDDEQAYQGDTSMRVSVPNYRYQRYGDNNYNALTTTLEGPGTFSFWIKTDLRSFEEDGTAYNWINRFTIFINGRQVQEFGGRYDWQQFSVQLPAGYNTVVLRYSDYGKIGSWTHGDYPPEDQVWIDKLSWSGETHPLSELALHVEGVGSIQAAGGINCDEQCDYTFGSTESFELTPKVTDPDWRFSHWRGACQGAQSQCVIDSSAEVTAVFEFYQGQEVTTVTNEGGRIQPQSLYLKGGETGELNVVPSQGYHLESISGCGGELRGSVYHVGPITAACQVSAEFALNYYAVQFDLGEHGERTGGGELTQSVGHGRDAQAPVVAPNDGWHFAGWDGSLTAITQAMTVNAIYQEVADAYTVNLNLTEGGTTPLSAVQYVEENTYLTIPLFAADDYRIATRVDGNCPAGEWVTTNQYRVGPIQQSCQIGFTFDKQNGPSGGALLLIMAVEAAEKDD